MKPVDPQTAPDVAAREEYRRQILRMPVTMRPALNQQLNGWDDLFPFEQKRLARFLDAVSRFEPAEFDALTQPLRELETKMDVAHWNFSVSADSLLNASQLARSPFYGEWRRDVEKVFSAVETKARDASQAEPSQGRLVLLSLPESLPVTSIAPKKPWDPRAMEFRLEGDARQVWEMALSEPLGLPMQLAQAGRDSASDCWVIDADGASGEILGAGKEQAVSLLEYRTLREFRDALLSQVNTVPKDIAATDEIFDEVRRKNWEAWWPRTLAGQDRLRSFVVQLFLSGNGALIFSNAFVQWAASEALRRARPRLVACRFGLRSRPKPFTSIAIFENQQKISALEDEDDLQGSAVDALILARYVWLSALRYPEREQTSCVVVAESSRRMQIIAPQAMRPAWPRERAVQPGEVCEWMRSTLKSQAAPSEP